MKMNRVKNEISNLMNPSFFNSLTDEQKGVQLKIYTATTFGLIQGIILSGSSHTDFVVKVNIDIASEVERLLPKQLLELVNKKQMIVSVVNVESGDGVLFK
jgi:hypothetical protein